MTPKSILRSKYKILIDTSIAEVNIMGLKPYSPKDKAKPYILKQPLEPYAELTQLTSNPTQPNNHVYNQSSPLTWEHIGFLTGDAKHALLANIEALEANIEAQND